MANEVMENVVDDVVVIDDAIASLESRLDKLSAEQLEKLVALTKKAKENAKAKKEAIKKALKAKQEANAVIAEKYYRTLKVGDEFTYVMANGTKVVAKKIATKTKLSKTAACEVVSGIDIEAGKTRKRYPNFKTVAIPEGIDLKALEKAYVKALAEAEKTDKTESDDEGIDLEALEKVYNKALVITDKAESDEAATN